MDRQSKHLSSEERGVIFAEHDRGSSQRVIGGLLGRPASTICRELARGRQDDGSYCPQAARLVHDVRRARCRRPHKLVEGSDIPPVSGKLSAALLLLYFSGGRDRMMTWDIHRNVRLRC